MKSPTNIESYQKHYSESGFWQKITSVCKRAGISLIYETLQLYYAATAPATPWHQKAIIYGALGYFILPADLVPDTIPVIGLIDDAKALQKAYQTCSKHITPTVQRNAKKRMSSWFSSEEISKL